MSKETQSTRRSFLKSGALLAGPLAATAPAAVLGDNGLKARLARFEDEAAIHELHRTWLRHVNFGSHDAANQLFAHPGGAAFDETVRKIMADHSAESDVIEITRDSSAAVGRFHCFVETATAIPQDFTPAQMAHAQGDGFVRQTERRVLRVEYVKTHGRWAMATVTLTSA